MYLKKMAPVSDTLMATMACSFSRWRVVQQVLKGQGVLTELSLWPYCTLSGLDRTGRIVGTWL